MGFLHMIYPLSFKIQWLTPASHPPLLKFLCNFDVLKVMAKLSEPSAFEVDVCFDPSLQMLSPVVNRRDDQFKKQRPAFLLAFHHILGKYSEKEEVANETP